MQIKLMLFFTVFFYLILPLHAASLDGTSSIKHQSTHYVLRDTDTVTGLVRFANGFTILPATNHASSAIMDTCMSCSGGFDLRETSTLKLTGNLILDTATTLTSGGKIQGYNKTLILGGNLTLNANQVIHLGGNLIIDGSGHDLFINEYAQFMLDNGATVTIKNATIHNKRNYPGRPALTMTTTLCRLTLSDVELALDSDLYINSGQLFIHNDVAVTGTSALVWHSIAPCTIEPNSNLYFDIGTTFSYAPPCTNKNLMRMTDQSSTLHLNGCSLSSTHTGLRLATGTVIFDNRITINSAACYKLNTLTEKTNIDTGRIEDHGVQWSPNGKYMAIGGEAWAGGNELAVYSFNGSSFTSVATYDLGTAIKPVKWSPDGKYIAVGGYNPTNGNELQVLSFNGTSLTLVDSADFNTTMFTLNWSPDGQYIAAGVGSSTTVELKVYRFDGKKLFLVQSQDYSAANGIYGLDWSPDGLYLAIGGKTPTTFGAAASSDELQVYKFDRSTLTPITSQDYGTSISTCAWSPDGKFLAIGGNTPTNGAGGFNDTNELRIYSFNGTTLTAVTSQDYGTGIYDISWSPDGKYLALGGAGAVNGAGGFNNTNELRIYSFNGSTLTAITSQAYGGNGIFGTSWTSNQSYLAVGGWTPTDGNEFKLYTCNYLNETATQAVSNGILLGNSSAGANQDATVKILADAQVVVNGILNVDNA